MIDFDTTIGETKAIARISKRAVKLLKEHGIKYPLIDCQMDITAVHKNDIELDLERLEKADNFNFAHDIFGIYRHINRVTGKLENCFIPRCSKK